MSDKNSSYPPTRWCDLVMEGGLTSGVVYPPAVAALKQHYQFRSIGGTSAGAIAAAATAAAELDRRRWPESTKPNEGFRALENLSDELGQEKAPFSGSRLLRLFKPQAPTKPLFSILLGALNRKSAVGRILGALWAAYVAFLGHALIGFLLVVAPLFLLRAWPAPAWLPFLLLAAIASFVAVALGLYRCLTRALTDNGFGICNGYTAGANDGDCSREDDPLTLWLSRLVNRCAGNDADGPPVTFGDLWKAPRLAVEPELSADSPSIRLQMVTTNLSRGRPYVVPHSEVENDYFFGELFLFCPDELKKYFPHTVMTHLEKYGREKMASPAFERDTAGFALEGLLPLPDAQHIPIVFAARLSLSFPLLLSAVPLWMLDRQAGEWRRTWFSDGGICSNFPIHFFDTAALPVWPTFGISLEAKTPYCKRVVTMPRTNQDCAEDPWFRFEESDAPAPAGEDQAKVYGAELLGGFLIALFNAARGWRDRSLARTAGVRDRVVRIALTNDEGGLNLKMDETLLTHLQRLGKDAAQEIIGHFVEGKVPEGGVHPMDLENHRWMRLIALLAAQSKQIDALERSLTVQPPDVVSWPDLIAKHTRGPAELPDQNTLTAETAACLRALASALKVLAENAQHRKAIASIEPPARAPVIRLVPDS